MTTRLLSTQRIVNIADDPATGSAGEIYYNSTQNVLRYHDGTQWTNFYASTLKHLVKNDSGVTLPKGTVVYTSGANGSNILVKPSSNLTDPVSAQTLGFLETTLGPNGQGYAINNGLITGIDTSLANAGDPVWLSASAGLVIYGFANEPKAPNHLVYLGVVTRSNQNNGEIFVHISNGWELDELHNVRITSASANHIINYNAASAIWVNENLATVIGRVDGAGSGIDADLLDGQHGTYYAPIASPTFTGTVSIPQLNVTTSASVSSDNTYWALTLNNSQSDGGTNLWKISPTGSSWTAGDNKLVFTYDGVASSSAIVTLDGPNKRVGINTASPSSTLHITASSSATVATIVRGASSQSANLTEWQNNSGTVLASMSASGNFSAVTKSFDITHPTKENMRLRYGSLEGPENGVYVRGKSNSRIITLPDYWIGLVEEDSITVHITPIGNHKNFYVKDVSNNQVTIGGGMGKVEFFYFIQAERKDVDKLVVEYGS